MKKTVALLVILFSISLHAFAQKSQVFKTVKGAINGYDAVAYFTESKPVSGKKEYSYTWKEATWHFSSQQNLEVFKSNPATYAPQYGGYCAYGMSQGYKATTEPDAWTIVGGKLYLNYNKDVRKLWNEKQAEYIQIADKNWPQVSKME